MKNIEKLNESKTRINSIFIYLFFSVSGGGIKYLFIRHKKNYSLFIIHSSLLNFTFAQNKKELTTIIMSVFKPFKGFRPKAELAEKIACRPYDVLNSQKPGEESKSIPHSFLHILNWK